MVGTVWSPETFKEYLGGVIVPSWVKSVTLHHCGEPNLAQRPNGFKIQHIINIMDFYKGKGWSAGPHLFIDEDQIFGMTSLYHQGIHAVSFNKSSIGIEVLGDYDCEDPFTGRGFACWQVAAKATRALLDWANLDINSETVLFHRNDIKTNKTCPGSKIEKSWFLELVSAV